MSDKSCLNNEIFPFLLRRKLHTLLTLFAISVGIFALTVVGSLSEFINEMMLRSERDSVNRIHIWSKDWENPINEGTLDGDVLAEVVIEAGVIGGLGVLTGWGAAHLANAIMDAAFGMSIFKTTPRLAVVFTVLLGMIAGLYPAWRASRLDPVVALRTE